MSNQHTTTKVHAGSYEYRGFFIERREQGDWAVGELGEWAGDIVDTLNEGKLLVDYTLDTLPIIQAEREAYAEDLQRTVNNTTQDTDNMTLTAKEKNAALVAKMNAEAAAWMDENAHLLPAEIDGDGTPVLKSQARPESDKALYTMCLSGNDIVGERNPITGSEKVSKDSAEPSTDLGDSIADPSIAGMYFATRAEATRANRERATHGIADLVLAKDCARATPTKRVRRKRMSAAEKAAAIRARRNPKPAATVAVEEAAPAFSPWTGRPAPYAHSDAGNGPLSIVDTPAPETLSVSVAEVSSFPQYVVDTIGYESGKSPYQISLRAARNSDITG